MSLKVAALNVLPPLPARSLLEVWKGADVIVKIPFKRLWNCGLAMQAPSPQLGQAEATESVARLRT